MNVKQRAQLVRYFENERESMAQKVKCVTLAGEYLCIPMRVPGFGTVYAEWSRTLGDFTSLKVGSHATTDPNKVVTLV